MLTSSSTPVQEIHDVVLDKAGVRLLIKREDLNHPFVSGNKWWKLKYNLEEAIKLGHNTLLTFGGAYSNHIYATAAAAHELGLKSIGIVRGEETLPLNHTLDFAISRGMQLHYLSRELYRITITVFTDVGSPVLFGGEEDVLSFGDGTLVLVPETPNSSRFDLGPNVGMTCYSIVHTYPGPGQYTISYPEPNRNAGIINMNNSVTTPFYVETTFSLDTFLGMFITPDFLIDPFFSAKLGSDLSLSVGAFSQEEDFVILYELTTPNLAMNYRLPENFNINQFNGLIT